MKISAPRAKFASTKNLKELVIGRCYEYRFQRSVGKTDKWDCGEIWAKLFEAFAYKGPCDVKKEDYETVLDLMEEDVPKDKVSIVSHHIFSLRSNFSQHIKF